MRWFTPRGLSVAEGNASTSCDSWLMSSPPHRPVAAGFALPAAVSASALLMLSSLSLQTLALHHGQHSHVQLQRAQHSDALQSAAMAFLQQAHGANGCLLRFPSARWSDPGVCPAADPRQLQQGDAGEYSWQLIAWQPTSPSSGNLQLRWADGRESILNLERPQ